MWGFNSTRRRGGLMGTEVPADVRMVPKLLLALSTRQLESSAWLQASESSTVLTRHSAGHCYHGCSLWPSLSCRLFGPHWPLAEFSDSLSKLVTGDPAVHIESPSQGSKRERPSLETCVARGKRRLLGGFCSYPVAPLPWACFLSWEEEDGRELVWCRLDLAGTQLAWPP